MLKYYHNTNYWWGSELHKNIKVVQMADKSIRYMLEDQQI